MSPLRRLWNVLRRTRMDDDLRIELETHLALIEDEERASGASAEQARRNARSRFGSPLVYRERALDAVIATWLERTAKEIVFASRRLTASPAFTAATVLTMALAIGANTSIFAVVQRVRPESPALPGLGPADRAGPRRAAAQPAIRHGHDAGLLPSLLGPRAHARWRRALQRQRPHADRRGRTGTDPCRPGDDHARAGAAGLAGARALVHRRRKASRGRRARAVLSHGLWLRRYGGDPGIVGRSVILAGVPMEVIGVMPASFAFPDSRIDVWLAEPITRSMGFGIWVYNGVARLRAGATVADVRTELNGLIADVPQAFPGDPIALGNAESIKLFSNARALKEATVGNVARARSGFCWRRWGSSCSSRAPTSPTCFSFAPRPGSGRWRCGGRSARVVSASPATSSLRARCSRWRAARLDWRSRGQRCACSSPAVRPRCRDSPRSVSTASPWRTPCVARHPGGAGVCGDSGVARRAARRLAARERARATRRAEAATAPANC